MQIRKIGLILLVVIISSPLALFSGPGVKNIIIISIDTLRADHLGCYGYYRQTSPNIDQFARDGILYKKCYAQSPLTTPSLATMLCSLPPFMHGAKRNGLSLYDKVVTLPMILSKHDYKCAAFISNWPLRDKLSGLGRGFEEYLEIFNQKRYLGMLNAEGNASKVNEAVFNWLEDNDDEPSFLWIHYTEPHAPYVYHKKFDREYHLVNEKYYPGKSNFKRIKNYDTEIGYTDFHFGNLIKQLKEKGIYQDALIIFVADHGESFGEHDYYQHGRKLFNSCLHLSLIIKLPEAKRKGTTIKKNVSIMDIPPTILKFARIPVPKWMKGQDIIAPDFKSEIVFSEAYRGVAVFRRGKYFKRKVKPIRFSITNSNYKVIYNVGNKSYEAYDQSSDWFEENNIISAANSEIKNLQTLLKTRIEEVKIYIELGKKYYKQKNQLTREDLEKLKSLGYIDD